MEHDSRPAEYHDLTEQLVRERPQTLASARKIFGILFEYLRPQSILDVGCGLGTWLAAACEMGIADVHGIEGQWLDLLKLDVPQSQISICDLENGFALQRQFDVVVCLEVAEHLPATTADSFVASLVAHGRAVLFSAAIPHQGGHHHVNEQFLDYWANLFQSRGFHALDIFRGRIWNDAEVLWYLRQNIVLFAHDSVVAAIPKLRHQLSVSRPLSIVHPAVYSTRIARNAQFAAEHAGLLQFLSRGGTFFIEPRGTGLSVKRMDP